MSSDSERLPQPTRRRRPILSNSESSDDSFIHINRGKKRVARVVSDGDSSDEDSDIPLHSVKKRKNHKIISEDESSYDSSSSNEGARNNFEGGSTSAEWQSDWESSEEESIAEASNVAPKRKSKDSPKKASSCPEHSSDNESDKCPICLLSFRTQEVANPAVCDHCFCLDCLIEWSKNVNTCPIDRQTFTVINVRAKVNGKIIRHVPIDAKTPIEEPVHDPTYCEVCQLCNREDRMLLCDRCDAGYHLECLDPPMDEVPLDEHWYCPECSRNSQNDAEDIDIDLEEIPDLLAEARELGVLYGRSRAAIIASQASRALLPRTRQTERVRANVRAGRNRRAAAAVAAESLLRHTEPQPSTSSGFDSISDNSVPGPSSSRRVTSSRSHASGSASSASRLRKTKSSSGKRKKKTKRRKTTSRRRQSTEFREVRISEVNENGELEEIVTYVRANNDRPVPSSRRRKKRKVLSDYED